MITMIDIGRRHEFLYLRTIRPSQVAKTALLGSKRSAWRQTRRNASCTMSSAASSRPSIRIASANAKR